jgi:hypothetical protein
LLILFHWSLVNLVGSFWKNASNSGSYQELLAPHVLYEDKSLPHLAQSSNDCHHFSVHSHLPIASINFLALSSDNLSLTFNHKLAITLLASDMSFPCPIHFCAASHKDIQ